MKIIPCATVVTLSADERSTLEALRRSTKSEARMRLRAGIVLLAADGMGTRQIGRTMGCTTGTASKWRVRYARDRLAGLDETGERGAVAKYGPAHQKRILAMLDQAPPAGYSNWTAPLLARALADIHEQYIWRFLRAQKIDLSGRNPGAKATTPSSSPKRPRSSACIWRRPRTRSSSPSMRSRPSKRWSGHKDISSCPAAAR